MLVCRHSQYDKVEDRGQSNILARSVPHPSDRRMRCEILPEIRFKVPRLERDVWVPVVPNIERCATLQVRQVSLRWRCQRE